MRVLIVSALMVLAHVSCERPNCPSPCRCTGLTVNCARKKLTEIPAGIPIKTTTLYLGYNRLTTLQAGAFSNLPNLKVLSLKSNLILSLNNGTFDNLSKLSILYLTKNKISTIEENAFSMLASLQKLYLTDNQITKIPDLSGCVKLSRLGLDNNRLKNVAFPNSTHELHQLISVVLNHNPAVQAIHKSDLAPLAASRLTRLEIAFCGLQSIENGTLAQLPALQSLQLAYNKLDGSLVHQLVDGLGGSKSLQSLDLDGVMLGDKLPSDTFNALKGVPLLHLSLRHCKLAVLQNGTFQYLDRLVSLDLSYSQISFAQSGAFHGLDSLKKLLLYHNKFDSFPIGMPPTILYLDISHNLATSLDYATFSGLVQLKELYIHDCHIAQIVKGTFSRCVKLETLDLSYNALPNNNVGHGVFDSLSSLKTLKLSYNKLVNFEKEHSILSNLQNLETLKMNNNNCQKLPADMFSNLSKLTTLDLSYNFLGPQLKEGGLLMTNLGNLVSLDLSNNQISKLPSQLLQNKAKLQNLNLRTNYISNWEGALFKSTKSLQKLDVSSNAISVLNQDSLHNLEQTMMKLSLNLSNNPFSCYCSLIWFRYWVNTTNVTLVNLDSYTCNSPKNMLHHRLLDFHPDDITELCWPPPWPFIVGGVASGVFLASSVLGILLYRKRWSLRLWWYLRTKSQTERRHRRRQAGDREAIMDGSRQPGGYKYDCFVSVSDYTADEDWVRDLLLPIMDNGTALGDDRTGAEDTPGKFSLVSQSVHLPAGEIIHLQAANAIGYCEKVMIVLSKHYLRDGRFAEFELGLAMKKVDELGWRAVILVVLEPGADVRLPYGQLHQVLECGEALRWTDDPDGQELFWTELENRLREQLDG